MSVPGRRAHVRQGRHPSRQEGRRLTRRQPGKPSVRARWVAKKYKTHARPELYASTAPLEALKVVLSEVATGKREGKVVALVDAQMGVFLRSSTKKSVLRTGARRLPRR